MKPRTLAALALIGFAAAVAANALAARGVEKRHPPGGRFITVDGVRLHLLEAGPPDAPAIVLVHGNLVHAHDWWESGVAGQLARSHRVLGFDRPGCGYSARPGNRLWTPAAQAALLAQAMRELGVGPAVVVGQSLGVQLCLRLALDFPAQVRALVLISGYYAPRLRLDSLLAGLAALPVLGDAVLWSLASPLALALSPLFAKAMFAPQPAPPHFIHSILPLARRPGQLRATVEDGFLMWPEAMALARRYREISAPVLVLAAEEERVVPQHRQSPPLVAALPSGRLVWLGAAGHMAHYTATDRITAAIGGLAGDRALEQAVTAQIGW